MGRMLPVYLHITLVAAVATLLASWCGWWMSRLLLPPTLRAWGGLVAPLMGYGLLLVAGYWLARDWLGLPIVLAILLPLTGVLNALAWRLTGPPRFIPSQTLRHIPLALLLVMTFAAGVAPLVSYGYPGVIGENWDVENYLPVARYLERGPVSAILSALPNPLRDLNADPPAIGLILGFSILHGSVDLLTGQEAITTFAILLAWLRALGIAAVYLLFRATLNLRREWALLGTAMVSAGGLLLWVEYFNFGMQLAAWPAIPLGLVLGIGAVQHASERGRATWPSLAGAAIILAALPIAYYPALTLFLPLAVGLGVALLIQGEGRLRMLAASGALLLLTLLVSIPAIYDYTQGFSFRYSQQLTSLGLFRFVPLTDFAGLTTFELRADPPVPLVAWTGLGSLIALMLAGLLWGPSRIRWLGLLAGAIAYLLWLRLEDYPYAWMKGGAYAAFPFLGLAAAGAQGCADRLFFRPLRYAGGTIALALLALMASSQGQTIAARMDEPGLFADELPEMLSLRSQIPPGSIVRLTSDPRIRGVKSALPAYLLDHVTVIGTASTGYVPHWENGEREQVGDYAVLLNTEEAEVWGYSRNYESWRGGGFALYRNGDNVRLQSRLDEVVEPQELFPWPFSTTPAMTYPLGLDLAAFEPTVIGRSNERIGVPAGLSRVSLATADVANLAVFLNSGPGPVTVVRARTPDFARPPQFDATSSAASSIPASVLARANSHAVSSTVTTTLDLLLPDAGPVTIALDIWDDRRAAHYGWYGVEQGRAEVSRTLRLALDLNSGNMTALDQQSNPVPIGGGLDRLARGDYIARLNVLAGTVVMVAPVDLFSFSVEADGTISNVAIEKEPPLIATTLDRPPVPLEAQVSDDTLLLGYALGNKKPRPGDEVPLTLWWRADARPGEERSILIHLLDAHGQKRAQADGPPAGGGHPTSRWEPGELAIDKHTLKIPGDLPEGDYKIAVGMYRYPSLELLPLTRDGVPLDGNVIHIPLRVER